MTLPFQGIDWTTAGTVVSLVALLISIVWGLSVRLAAWRREVRYRDALNGGMDEAEKYDHIAAIGMKIPRVRRYRISDKMARPGDPLIEETSDSSEVDVTVSHDSEGELRAVSISLTRKHRTFGMSLAPQILALVPQVAARHLSTTEIDGIDSQIVKGWELVYLQLMYERSRKFRELVGTFEQYINEQPRDARWLSKRIARREPRALTRAFQPFVDLAFNEYLESDDFTLRTLARTLVASMYIMLMRQPPPGDA